MSCKGVLWECQVMFSFHLGVWGWGCVRKNCVCDPHRSQPSATVRNRLRWRRKALHSGECVWSGPESVSNWLLVATVILAFAEEVSPRVICGAAVVWVFAEEVSVRVICVAAVIFLFAEEVSVRVICGAAVILVFAEEVSVKMICGAAVILVFAEEVSMKMICVAAVILVFAEEVCENDLCRRS